MPKTHSSLRRDFGVFADPGFLVTLVLLLLVFAATTALLIYGTGEHAVPLPMFGRTSGTGEHAAPPPMFG